ncbi:MAG: UDP-N-acetylmuramate--L-alanine ligase [Verrucomicrobiaceae bacterium]|nr:UDP-N-acetylmuramate--L-alanine ligase [Verrucomicrobiaceae bacterium]
MSDLCQQWGTRFARRENRLRVHLIGVAGSGMSGLGSLLLGLGHRVSGSDRVTSRETERLEKAGLVFSSPHCAEAVADADVVVYSSAIKPGNAAYDEALRRGIPLLRRAEALAAIMQGKQGVVVAGTHGKTTTSSLAAHVLKVGAKSPSHYVGAEIPILGTNANWDENGEFFVAEGDESDGTLVNFHPAHAILLNVEAEHLDFYDGIDAICAVFGQFCDQTSGKIFYCGEDANARRVCGDRDNAISYGWSENCDFSATNLSPRGAGTEFTVVCRGEEMGRVRLGIPGRHNVLNALAVIAFAVEVGVAFDRIDEALASFRGARRRFEMKRNSERVTIVDDYGHHPTEIAATLQTARSQHAGRLICLFQPHRYSRTQLLREEFGACFEGVDELWVTDIYAASETPIDGISGQTIVDAVTEHGEVEKVVSHPSLATLHLAVGAKLEPGDWVLTLGAGNIHEVGSRLARDLAALDLLTEALAEPTGITRLYEPMRRHTTMKVGGPAQFWVEPTSVAGLARVVKYCTDSGTPLRVIGRGSNLLVRDGGIPGVVVHPVKGEFGLLHVEGNTITAGAGVKYKALAAAAQSAGLGDFEWMEGIPGNVGGSLRMNAGAMGWETFDQVVRVTMIDAEGRVVTKEVEEIRHHYRHVPELAHNIAVSAVFKGTPASDEVIAGRMAASKEKRRASQPVAASAGCIFKNPGPIGAGQLVDEMGLKESAVGSAKVSEVHGNFIVNDGTATATEVLALIARIQEIALRDREVKLETEVQVIGQDEPI